MYLHNDTLLERIRSNYVSKRLSYCWNGSGRNASLETSVQAMFTGLWKRPWISQFFLSCIHSCYQAPNLQYKCVNKLGTYL